ncbi:hypothetical protein [Pseudonocardia asaccharolytica]|uniref:AMP-binding enzyme C-terminal domain-containing protein n=1 Tax=Pseudonocardia asaccharolytica DSM 44247 = NBRC 16224 TaxID=1123024 RepID=A0A511D816_9PSEU|nr:hypothetical protein PA7_47490 [Pseudonocardia asaccharolytica DSM 44247 = NBRC 16224]
MIVAVPAVPRTLTGKKLEVPVERILQGARPAEVAADGAITHPEMLAWFARYARSSDSLPDSEIVHDYAVSKLAGIDRTTVH